MIDMAKMPIGVALNGRPKYVVSTSLTDPPWAGTNVLTGDVAAAVRDLKAKQDGELLVPGSGVLVRWLLANDLVDQLHLLTDPDLLACWAPEHAGPRADPNASASFRRPTR